MPLTDEERRRLLAMARWALAHRLETGKTPSAGDIQVELTEALREPRPVFVTVYVNGMLRGCRGQVASRTPLFHNVLTGIVSSALHDERFPPVRADELPDVRISISILTPMRPVDGPGDIRIGEHGVVLEKEGRRALFLPRVAPDNGWDLETTLDHLASKAGLPPGGWRRGARFEVFGTEEMTED